MWHWWHFHDMYTQPLLFDDSMSILQKLCVIWKKLNELIEDYNTFKQDFAEWKNQVENH